MGHETDPPREQELLADVLELAEADREAFLRDRCGGDPALRERILRLLAAHERSAAYTGERVSLAQVAETRAGQRVGPYRLKETLGEGGMGVVFLAEQDEPIQREVAFKVIRAGRDTSQVVARFEAERQALARMEHPGIAKVFDAGTTEAGQPFFVMELVRGDSITAFCDHEQLSVEDRLVLFEEVCSAVQHAHQKGVIHRDLKPSNILVARGERPQPKVIDFGIAKPVTPDPAEPGLTVGAQVLGTPEYMSPEQASSDQDIDTRSDVYSLGVLLYELLTGSHPFDVETAYAVGFGELMRQIAEVEPDRPSTRITARDGTAQEAARLRGTRPERLIREIRGELDWIVLKALEKDRARRYESVGEFAADVRNYLENRPVSAGPPSTAYRLAKFVRRNRLLVGSVGIVAATVLASAAGLGVLYAKSVESERIARLEADTTRESLRFMLGMFELAEPSQARGERVTAREILDSGAARIERELVGQPEVRSRLTTAMGRVYAGLGLYERAERLLQRALGDRSAATDGPDPESLRLQSVLASVRGSQSRQEEAEALLRETLKEQRALLGEDHVDTLDTLVRLSEVLEARSLFGEAEEVVRLAESRARALLGGEHGLTLAASIQLGVVQRATGNFTEAERTFARVWETRRRLLGDDHPESLRALVLLARAQSELGLFDLAEASYQEALDLTRKVLGGEHLDTLKAQADYGMLLSNVGREADAERQFEDLIEAMRGSLGDDHVDTLLAINSLGVVQSHQGRFEDSESSYLEAYDGLLGTLGERNEHTLTVSGNLAILYLQTGRLEEAERFARTTYDASVELVGAGHADSLMRLENLGNVLFRLGDREQVVELLGQVLTGRRSIFGNDHPAVTRTLVNVAVVGRAAGDLQAAHRAADELLERSRAGVGFDVLGVAAVVSNYARDLSAAADHERAADCVEVVLRIRLELLGDEHEETLEAMRSRLTSCLRTRRWEEVRAEAPGFYAAHERALGGDHADTVQVAERLLEGAELLGDDEQIDRWIDVLGL